MARGSPTGSRFGTKASRGYTYLGLLFLLAIVGAVLARYGEVEATIGQRERERELLFRGFEIKRAIESYARTTPAGTGRWPTSLQDLVVDRRHADPKYHLRRAYVDPFTRQADWVLLPAADSASGFAGVRSKARIRPVHVPKGLVGDTANCICDWRFLAEP